MGDITNNISPPTMPNMHSQAASMSAKIMVIGIIVLFFVLACCFILSLYAKWYWSRNEDPTVVAWRRNALRSGAQQQQTGARKRGGLARATLRSIPMLMYDTKDFKEGLECSVCLSEITQGEKVRLLPKCNHGFHVECIDMWFKSHSTCPLCRNSIVSLSRDEESRAAPAHAGVVRDSSDSDSNSDSDSDSEQHENGSHAAGETISIPTNVLFFGNEVQVRSRGETANEDSATSTSASASASASTSGVNNQRDELVIDIPRDLCDDCSSSPPPPRAEIVEEGSSKTPVVSRLRSLKRLLSRGRMMPSWASGSSSIDIESMENKS